MTFRIVRTQHNWDRRGNAVNKIETVLSSHDEMGFAVAGASALYAAERAKGWNDRVFISFEAVDLRGKKYFLADVWEQMVSPEKFQAMLDEPYDVYAKAA
jgi:hypothetical protein